MNNPPRYEIDLRHANEPATEPQELAEIRLDEALNTIKNLDRKMAELRKTRETYIKQLVEALRELQQKSDAARDILNPSTNGDEGATRDLLA